MHELSFSTVGGYPESQLNQEEVVHDKGMQGRTILTILTSLQLFLFRTVRRAGPVPFTQCVTKGSFKAQWQETTYNFFTFSCLFLLPLTAMTICYSRIVFSVSSPQSRKGSPGETWTQAPTCIWEPLLLLCVIS